MSESARRGPSHVFTARVDWDGPGARPTTEVRRFSRAATASAGPEVPALRVSAARTFFGDRDAFNPETLLLSALAQCHLLAYLRLAGLAGYEVTDASVEVEGVLELGPGDAGRFVSARLSPSSRVLDAAGVPLGAEALHALHDRAHEQCFIANSLNFALSVKPDTGATASDPTAGE
ncbi:OsmC family protein [Galactobacter valiniphilus]|uniref:OsmC family protein n=1 Tax=Galactobacter valiniphilus TaxID=2676122 RepID=UPI0037357CBE